MQIPQLMSIDADDRGIEWLKKSLQAAIQLELATIPPYLCATWSIVDRTDPIRREIFNIALDEMAHMGLACNLLATIGGFPVVNTPDTVPKYPGPLPGGVRPKLRVWLAGFNRAMVRAVFMEIEYPEKDLAEEFLDKSFPTIGAFYDAILSEFKKLKPEQITGDRQISEVITNIEAILNIADVEKAIKRIKEEGEGTSQSPSPGGMVAHYYRFSEIYYGRRLIQVNGHWKYAGDEVAVPVAYPMSEVPACGYTESRGFDTLYTRILDNLTAAWGKEAKPNALNEAIEDMRKLEEPAIELMRQDNPTGFGSLGPSFLLTR